VYDRETISELNTFVHSGGKIGALPGKYDDRVMALFLGCLEINPDVKAKIETVHSINSIALSEVLKNKVSGNKVRTKI
jgi:hypothetical protein